MAVQELCVIKSLLSILGLTCRTNIMGARDSLVLVFVEEKDTSSELEFLFRFIGRGDRS